MRQRFLLGTTANRELVFGEFDNPKNDSSEYWGASFDTVTPFDIEDINLEYAEGYLEGFPKEDLYLLCERYDCAPSELAQNVLDEAGLDLVDTSIYSEQYTVNGITYAFESSCGGQHDIFEDEEMVTFTNEDAVRELYKLWKKYHLTNYNQMTEEEYQGLCDMTERITTILSVVDEQEFIEDFLRKEF